MNAAVRPSSARDLAGLWMAIAGSVAFSGKAIIVKLSYRHGVDALTLIMLRMLVALPLFLLLVWWAGRGRPALDPRTRVQVLALGFSGYYLASLLDFLGLQHITASLERLILYLMPMVVLGLNRLLFGQRATARQLGALVLGYGGLALVFGHELRLDGPQVATGAALVFASTLSYAAYLVGSGRVVARVGALRLSALAGSVACGLCLAHWLLARVWQVVQEPAWPGGAAAGGSGGLAAVWWQASGLPAVATEVWWLALLNGTLCTVLPVALTMAAIERIGASRAAQLGMSGPLSTIALGIVLLGEPLTGWLLAGSACVLAGVALLARGR
ncbi:MAG: hypothetical protein RLY78_777 [Pseudomonadota bacterium]